MLRKGVSLKASEVPQFLATVREDVIFDTADLQEAHALLKEWGE